MQIRSYKDTDREQVIDLWARCGLIKPQNDPIRDIARKQQVGAELFLVGERGGTIIAAAMGGYEGHRGWVNYLAVDPDCRRQRLGQAMMENLEQRLLALGCPKLNLQVRSTNADVIAFYQALGYQVDPVTSLGKRLIED